MYCEFFFEFDLQLFFNDLVLIENHLILIFYKSVRLKENDLNENDVKHGWRVISFEKDIL
jgi:hypothetical protein